MIENKKKGPPCTGGPESPVSKNQATENIGNTPRSFLRMRITIDIVKEIATAVAPFLIACVFNYSRIVPPVK
jgi:hypothetical protein